MYFYEGLLLVIEYLQIVVLGNFFLTFVLSPQSLSVAQLEALGPDNAAMVTSEQQAALRDEQLATLERAMTGSQDQTPTSDKSGKKIHVHRCKLTYSSV